MKRFVQTRDVLDCVRQFHGQLGAYFDSMSQIAEKKRVKLLLDYLGRHERRIEECVAEYEANAPGSVMKSWFQFMPRDFPPNCFEENRFESDMSVDDVISIALHFDESLVELYRVMVNEAELSDAKELFTTLLKMEEEEEKTLARDSLWLKDM